MVLIFQELQDNEWDFNQIVWHNLKMGEALGCAFFSAAVLGWFKLYPDRNFQDLESYLRAEDFQTYVIATPFTKDVKKNYSLTYPYKMKEDAIPPTYHVRFSCLPMIDVMEEMSWYSKNYEDNFKKLKVTGSLMIKNIEIITNNDPELLKIDSKEITQLRKISLNQVLVCFG